MKRLLVVIGLLVMVLIPSRVLADAYYDFSVEQSDWQEKTGGGYYINKTFSVTKTIGNHVYVEILETTNVKITGEMVGSSFELVSKTNTDNGIAYLLKLKDGMTVNGKTELITIIADIVDPSNKKCELDYAPNPISCTTIEGHYFDSEGNEVTEAEQKEDCEGFVPKEDVPDTPNTGSVIPYIAIGGGLVAIAGVYLYSRKSNKVYKI